MDHAQVWRQVRDDHADDRAQLPVRTSARPSLAWPKGADHLSRPRSNLCQQYAVYTGGQTGIYLLQYTQLITCFGGGSGYMLTANTYTAELVSAEERTSSFGRIQGAAMLGMGAAFSLGGLTTDTFGSMWCFRVT